MFVTIAIPQYFLACFAAFGFFKAKKSALIQCTQSQFLVMWEGNLTVCCGCGRASSLGGGCWEEMLSSCLSPTAIAGLCSLHSPKPFLTPAASTVLLPTHADQHHITSYPLGAPVIDFSQNTHQILRSIPFQLLPQTAQPKAAARLAQIMQSQLFLQW